VPMAGSGRRRVCRVCMFSLRRSNCEVLSRVMKARMGAVMVMPPQVAPRMCRREGPGGGGFEWMADSV